MMAESSQKDNHSSDYDVPVVHVRVPERVGNSAFWLGLAGAVAVGVVEAPLAVLIAAGVVIVRHRKP